MKKQINYKLIELESHQVLIKKHYDPKTDEVGVQISTNVDNAEMSLLLGFDTSKQVDKAFNKMDENFVTGLLEQIFSKVTPDDHIEVTKVEDKEETFTYVDPPRPITWQELKDFVSTLTEEELKLTCKVFIDDHSYAIDMLEPMRIEEDIYVNKEEEDDLGTLEELKEIHGEEFKEENYQLCTPKGKPFLWLET